MGPKQSPSSPGEDDQRATGSARGQPSPAEDRTDVEPELEEPHPNFRTEAEAAAAASAAAYERYGRQ